MNGLLTGIRVVELGTHMAIPLAARLMADWGAEVIKVEPPKGEAWRTIGNSYGIPHDDDCNPIFQTPNTNKKNIAINLKQPEGRQVLMRLLEQSDVFLTNTRHRSLEKLGLAYDQIKLQFPRLIYAHFSGYGDLGPEKDRPGFDIAAYWAKAGMPLEWSTKESGPSRPLPGFGDSSVATVILSGILAALLGREHSGQGEYLKTSLYSCALWFNNCGLLQAQFQSAAYPRSRCQQPTPYHMIYQTRDGDYFFFSIPTWANNCERLLRMMHLDQYVGDARLSTLDACRQNMEFVAQIFGSVFSNMSTEEVKAGFQAMDCVFEVVADPKDIPNDPQAWANGYLERITLENGTQAVIPTPPVQFARAQSRPFRLASPIGGDSCQVLRSLGYSEDEVAHLLQQGAITQKV